MGHYIMPDSGPPIAESIWERLDPDIVAETHEMLQSALETPITPEDREAIRQLGEPAATSLLEIVDYFEDPFPPEI